MDRRERVGDDEEGGAGARVLRALGWGAVAGVVGGVLFTWVMVEIGFLGTVARLVGSRSPSPASWSVSASPC